MKKNNTENIERQLRTVHDYDTFLKENNEELTAIHPGSYLVELIQARSLEKKDLIKAVNLNTGYIYEIFRNEKRPERDKLLRFAFPLKLNIEETQTMLKRCGYALLYGKNPRDSLIMFCISRRKTQIETNILLHKYGFEIL